MLFGWFPFLVLGSQRFFAPHKKRFNSSAIKDISMKLGQNVYLDDGYPSCASSFYQRSFEVTGVKLTVRFSSLSDFKS